jgi:hypothetical protein
MYFLIPGFPIAEVDTIDQKLSKEKRKLTLSEVERGISERLVFPRQFLKVYRPRKLGRHSFVYFLGEQEMDKKEFIEQI